MVPVKTMPTCVQCKYWVPTESDLISFFGGLCEYCAYPSLPEGEREKLDVRIKPPLERAEPGHRCGDCDRPLLVVESVAVDRCIVCRGAW